MSDWKRRQSAIRRPKVNEEAVAEVSRTFIQSVQHLDSRIREEPVPISAGAQ